MPGQVDLAGTLFKLLCGLSRCPASSQVACSSRWYITPPNGWWLREVGCLPAGMSWITSLLHPEKIPLPPKNQLIPLRKRLSPMGIICLAGQICCLVKTGGWSAPPKKTANPHRERAPSHRYQLSHSACSFIWLPSPLLLLPQQLRSPGAGLWFGWIGTLTSTWWNTNQPVSSWIDL